MNNVKQKTRLTDVASEIAGTLVIPTLLFAWGVIIGNGLPIALCIIIIVVQVISYIAKAIALFFVLAFIVATIAFILYWTEYGFLNLYSFLFVPMTVFFVIVVVCYQIEKKAGQ